MSLVNFSRIDGLSKDNYDTWKLQMRALLTKNDLWGYVSGEINKPQVVETDATSTQALNNWLKQDEMAKSDIILSVTAPELKQIKNCGTSREMWQKLEGVYQSKGPARKATLLKQLTLQRMEEGGDVREHLNKFFDAVDKLSEMDVVINPDLMAIMLLYSLPSSYENFRCAIESRDILPTPEALRIKIKEEADARKGETRNSSQNALYTNKNKTWNKTTTVSDNKSNFTEKPQFRCYRCKRFGHKANECRNKNNKTQQFVKKSDNARNVNLFISEALHISESNGKWCLDSGATSHLCSEISKFTQIGEDKPDKLNLANNSSTEVLSKGTVSILTKDSGQLKHLTMNNALHVPDLRTNLISISKVTDNNLQVLFKKNCALIMDADGVVKVKANRTGDLYFVNEVQEPHCKVICEESKSELRKWHRRMGHLNVRDLYHGFKNNVIKGINIKNNENCTNLECDICFKGKMTRSPFPKKSNHDVEILEIVHSDLFGPVRVESHGKSKYMVTFTDEKSRWTEVRFLKSKDELLPVFKEYVNMVENQKNKRIKYLQTDNGSEYVNKEFDDYLKNHGISRRLTVPYNPEQNGISERKNRTLLDMARCLLIQSGLSDIFWAEAINTANYIRNRCPTSSLSGVTPFEVWIGRKPSVKYFREFGCRTYCLNNKPSRGKLEPRGKVGTFLGYDEKAKGYRIWLRDEKKTIISRDVKFIENVSNKENNESEYSDVFDDSKTCENNEITSSLNKEIEVQVSDNVEAETVGTNEQNQRQMLQESSQFRRGPGRPKIIRTGLKGRPHKQFNLIPIEENNEEEIEETNLLFNEALLSETPINSALSGPSSDEWYEAIAVEAAAVIKKKTWDLVDREQASDIIGSRFVLTNKYKPDGSLERRKARLVAQGFSQRPGVHFDQTFAPVARMSTIRLIAALANRFNLLINQLDVTTAYLNGNLDEEIYMEPPKNLEKILKIIVENNEFPDEIRKNSFEMLNQLKSGNKICRLNKALYGLKQAGRAWHSKLDKTLRELGAIPSKCDPCLYQLQDEVFPTLIVIYVDDILIVSPNKEIISRLVKNLSEKFEVRNLGDVKYCLGIEFYRDERNITLSQRSFILNLLERFGMTNSKPVKTPLDVNAKLSKSEEPVSDQESQLPYRELVGALNYLAVTTRPDISFAASCLGQFNNCYSNVHWTAAKRVLRYLKGTLEVGINYNSDEKPLEGYVDADWAGNLDDRKSHTGFVFMYSGGPISWESKKQRTVALSSTEAEFMSMTEAVKEAVYLRRIFEELQLEPLDKITLYNDNMGAIKLAENPVSHNRSKHIDLRYHFIRDAVKEDMIKVEHRASENMLADLLTKGLSGPQHGRLMGMLGLRQTPQLRLEGKC